ncbi:patatin-like phospholipase family protein [Enterococcus wangshanyuanii]|uniref:Patatin n=1 Tax=Enterococcus wangshanyuanii TaxID=2005703 RepID=A0ABQ1P5U2_9ENTE|nr:patatin-like phospholipase family protein [Enterococcus wangshanyuanii]GGC91361.1 patatin [Enterococcus wangshanyuanii]
MRIETPVASEWRNFAAQVAESRQLLPLFETHSSAREVFSRSARKNTGNAYVAYAGKIPYLFIMTESGRVTNLLLSQETLKIGWSSIFTVIEHLFKQTFQQSISFHFPHHLTLHLKELFLAHGYKEIEENRFSKVLDYHTSLVLGGGGARGAYQIGVWQALKELEIPIKLITGTSVGALNGALILQGDFEAAKAMWEEIDTKKILAFPINKTTNDTFGGVLSQVGAFTINAIQTKGVSTKPLQELIQDTFSTEKMQQVRTDFYLVTTELPNFQERVIHFNGDQQSKWQSWLLASASFFPAMAAAKIADKYYVDGGYRNNIPVDVAIEHGATECIIVDVKGPGITKPIKVSDKITCLTLQTPWSMGAVLLFDGARSVQNIKLGYLETMKMIGKKYKGYWYTFDETLESLVQFQQHFFTYIKETYQLKLWLSAEQKNKICKKMRKVYKDRVFTENIGLVLVELLAKNQDISAAKLYTLEEMIELLQHKEMKLDLAETIGMISVQEWLKKYYDDYFLLSEKQQLTALTSLLASNEQEKAQWLAILVDKLPVQVLQLLMIEFIQTRSDKEWHKNFRMKS